MRREFDQVYQFKITLKGVKPPIWRRIQVPESYTFWDFHVAIQDAMGWFDYHLHSFKIVNPMTGFREEIGIPDGDALWDDYEVLSGWDRKISQYFMPENNKALYIYDFSDDWHHDVKLEKILPRDRQVKYPLCLAGKRACPPEDCGGAWGYRHLLEVLSDPEHEEYEDVFEWVGEEFDPEYFDLTETAFTDPKERWDYTFGDIDDFREEALFDNEEEIAKEMKGLSHDYMHQIWEKAKSNDLDSLPTEEKRLGEIMLEHEEEFFNQFEFSDLIHDHVYDPNAEVNPFLHIYIHSIVERQLEEKDPIEAHQFYNAMRKKRCSHHEAIHLIGAILAPMIFTVIQQQKPFDRDTYKRLLNKYKTRRPGKIWELLNEEIIWL